MKSEPLGKSTSRVEVSNVSPHGFWLCSVVRSYLFPSRTFLVSEASIRQVCLSNGRLRIICTGLTSTSI